MEDFASDKSFDTGGMELIPQCTIRFKRFRIRCDEPTFTSGDGGPCNAYFGRETITSDLASDWIWNSRRLVYDAGGMARMEQLISPCIHVRSPILLFAALDHRQVCWRERPCFGHDFLGTNFGVAGDGIYYRSR